MLCFFYPKHTLAVFRPFRTNSAKKEKTKAKTAAPPKPTTTPTKLGAKPNTTMISSPAPHSFVHVSHVGLNTRGIIESSKNIEPAWDALIADMQGHGISPELMGNKMGFIRELVTGVASEPPVACAFVYVCGWIALTCSIALPAATPTPASPPPEKKRKIRRKVLIL